MIYNNEYTIYYKKYAIYDYTLYIILSNVISLSYTKYNSRWNKSLNIKGKV